MSLEVFGSIGKSNNIREEKTVYCICSDRYEVTAHFKCFTCNHNICGYCAKDCFKEHHDIRKLNGKKYKSRENLATAIMEST